MNASTTTPFCGAPAWLGQHPPQLEIRPIFDRRLDRLARPGRTPQPFRGQGAVAGLPTQPIRLIMRTA